MSLHRSGGFIIYFGGEFDGTTSCSKMMIWPVVLKWIHCLQFCKFFMQMLFIILWSRCDLSCPCVCSLYIRVLQTRRQIWNQCLLSLHFVCSPYLVHVWWIPGTCVMDARYACDWCHIHTWWIPGMRVIDATYTLDGYQVSVWWMPHTHLMDARYACDGCHIHTWWMPGTRVMERWVFDC